MEFALATVTVLSLVMTLSMGVVTWRLVREERRRSVARLAALAADFGRSTLATPTVRTPLAPPPRALSAPRTDPAPYSLPVPPRPPGSAHRAADVTIRPTDATRTPGVDRSTRIPTGGLFGAPIESSSGPSARLAAFGAAAVLLVAVVSAGIFVVADRGHDEVAAVERPPVELLVLQHDKEGPFLAISGSVRNPSEAAPAGRLAVMAMAFDENGTIVASGRAPVELDLLAPGVASPFAVQVPAAGVSRYRISFVIDDITVPHVDRRSAARDLDHPGTLPTEGGVS